MSSLSLNVNLDLTPQSALRPEQAETLMGPLIVPPAPLPVTAAQPPLAGLDRLLTSKPRGSKKGNAKSFLK